MNGYLKYLAIFFVVSVFYSCTPPQDYTDSPEHFFLFEKNRFYVDPLVFLDKDSLKPRLDIYIGIPSDNILFKKTGANGNYEMKLNISVSLTGADSSSAIIKNYDVSALFSEEDMKKISKEPRYFFYSYYPEPGKYNLEIKISDGNSKKVYKKKEEITVSNFNSESFSASDIMVLSGYKVNENGSREISPLVTNNISRLNDVYVFFEVYNKKDSVFKVLAFKIKNPKGEYIKEETAEYQFVTSAEKIFRNILSKSDFNKHKPDKKDFEEFDPDDKNFGVLLLEIWDKQENKIIASKKLSVLPDKHQKLPSVEHRQGIR